MNLRVKNEQQGYQNFTTNILQQILCLKCDVCKRKQVIIKLVKDGFIVRTIVLVFKCLMLNDLNNHKNIEFNSQPSSSPIL